MVAAEVRLLTDDEALTAKPYHHVTLLVGGAGTRRGGGHQACKCGLRAGVGDIAKPLPPRHLPGFTEPHRGLYKNYYHVPT